MLELRVRARGATLEAHVAPEGIAAAEDEDGESQTVNSAQVQATLAGISLSVVAEVALGSGPAAIPRRMEVIHGVMNSIEALISTKGRKAAVRCGTRRASDFVAGDDPLVVLRQSGGCSSAYAPS